MAVYTWSSSTYCLGVAETLFPTTHAFDGTLTGAGNNTYENSWFADGPANPGGVNTFNPQGILDYAKTVKITYCAETSSPFSSDFPELTLNGVVLPIVKYEQVSSPSVPPPIEEITVDVTGVGLQSITINQDPDYRHFVGLMAIEVDGVELQDGVEYEPPVYSPIESSDLFLVNRSNVSYKVQGQNLNGLWDEDIIVIDDGGVSKKVPKSKWGIIPDSAWVLVNRSSTSYKVSGVNFKNYLGL